MPIANSYNNTSNVVLGPPTSSPPTVVPGPATGTNPIVRRPTPTISSNTEVTSNAIPEAVPTPTVNLPTASNTTLAAGNIGVSAVILPNGNSTSNTANTTNVINIYNTYQSNVKVFGPGNVLITNAVQQFNFTGTGVTVTGGGITTVDIPGATVSTITIQGQGTNVVQASTVNFVGNGITTSNVSGVATVTVNGLAVQDKGFTVVASPNRMNFVGNGVAASNLGGVATVTINGTTIQDEGSNVLTGANTINFVGNGVVASNVGGVATVTINSDGNGISGITVQDEGVNVLASATTINFVGSSVTASNVGNVATITISGGNTSNISNGTSNVTVTSNGNVTTSVNGNANILVVTGTGANINGYANISGNLSIDNVSSNLIPNANVTYDLGNASYRWKDLYLSDSTIYLGPTASLRAGAMTNGNSNVNMPASNGNINMSVAGNSNVVVFTGTGANINGYANITGNVALSGANVSLGAVGNVRITGGTANYVLTTNGAGGLSWANIAGGGAGNIAGGSNTQVQYNDNGIFGGNPGMTFDEGNSRFTANNLVATSTANLGNVGNVHITGGTANYVLSTDGNGNLSWVVGGGAAAVAGANTQVQFNDGGVMGANANLTFDKTTGNLTVGSNVVAVNFIGSGANTPTIQSGTNLDLIADVGIRVPSNISMTGANVSLGAVANLHITGGVGGQILQTDGAGGLSWINPASGGNTEPAGQDFQLQYNQGGVFGANTNLSYDYANSNLWVGNRDNAWIDPVVGTARGNLFVRGAITVGSSQFGSGTDTEAVIRMLDTTSAYGFTSLSTGILAITNEEASFNQAIILGDSCKGNAETIFGVSTYPGGNGVLSTGQPPEVWSPVLDVRGNNFFVPVIASAAPTANALYFNPANGRVTYGTASGIAVQDEGSNVVTTTSIVNFVGNGVVASNVGGVATITIPGNDGNGNPGGANTQVQYNDNGIFGGNPGFTFDESNTLITANNFVATSTANLGNVANVTILGGNANFVLTTDGTGVLSWTNGSAIANVAAGGANTQVQYNDNGILGGNPGMTFNELTSTLTANNFVATSTANLGDASNVTVLGGTNGYYLQTDGAGNLTWGPGSNSTGNGSVAGANTQVQFNDEGNFGAVAGFTFNKTSTTLTANNIVASSTANLGAVGNVTILGGTANFVLTTDGTGNLSWGNGGLANVAGSNTQIQFNDGGVFGANAGFTFDKTDGWLRSPGNITALSEIHFGYEAGSNAINDAWGRMQMFMANGANQGYGFTYQAGVSAGGNNQLVITNEESTFNQAFVMADGLRGAPGTAFGFSILDKSGPPPNSTPTTGSEAGWMSLLEVDYYGNFNLPGTTNLSNVPIVDSGTANVGGLISRGKSYLNDVSNVTIEGGTNGYFLQTDGTGNLTWSPASGNSNANSSVAGANTQIQFNDEGNFGAAAGFTFNKTTTTLTANNIVGTSTVNFLTASNVSLGTVANVHIGGGNANFILTTDGSGGLSWANLAAGGVGNIAAGGANTQVQYNDNGILGGNPAFTFDEGNTLITANNFVATSSANLGDVGNVTILGGTNGYVLQTDGTGNLTWTAQTGGNAGNGNPGGANTQVQYNDNGNFGGNPAFIFNETTTLITANNLTVSSVTRLGNVSNVHIDGGTANFILTTDGTGNLSWANLAAGGVGNIGAAGANTQVQYNDDGVLGGNPAFTFDEGLSLVTANNFVATSTANLGNVGNVTITGGNANFILTTDGTGNLSWANLAAGGAGNIGAAGANTQVQYNDDGVLGGNPAFTFDEGNTLITANNLTVSSISRLGDVGNVKITGGNMFQVLATADNSGQGNLGWADLVFMEAAGANTQVQYNDDGVLGGNPAFTFDEGLTLVTANNFVATSTANLGDVGNVTITGGTANYVLSTDGSGNLSWIAASGTSITIQDEGSNVLSNVSIINFVGNGVVASNVGGVATITIGGGNGGGYYLHTQSVASNVWTVTHNLDTRYVVVEPVDANNDSYNGRYDFPTIDFVNNNTLTMTWETAVDGYAAVVGSANSVSVPGGSNGQIQFNNGGAFGGIPNVTYSGGNLSLGNIANVKITGGSNGQFLTTDGNGNLSWSSSNSTGNISVFQGVDFIVSSSDLYFNGPLVNVTNVFDTPQVEIGLTVKDEGTTVGLEKCFGTINFAGAGVTVTRPGNGNVALVTIPGGGGSGVSAPYIRTYTGNATTQCTNNNYWYPIPLDNDALVNDIGAYDYINGVTSLQPGTYFFESTVYLNCTGSDTIQGAYVCLIANPSISLDPILGTSSPAPAGNVLAKAGVARLGDYSTTPIMGVGTFTIVTETKVSLAFSQYDASPQAWSFSDEFNLGYNTTILKLWKTA
jgi:hypothetical protein